MTRLCLFIMCSDGVGRTGAFISIHAEMERMKAETVADLFQFIKGMRVQRAEMVSNKVHPQLYNTTMHPGTIFFTVFLKHIFLQV